MNGFRSARLRPDATIFVKQKKGRSPAPFLDYVRASYLIALSVTAEVQAPVGSLAMIFWSSSALAVRW